MSLYQTEVPKSVSSNADGAIDREEIEPAEQIITCLVEAIESRDPITASHCQRVSALAELFGQFLGISSEEIRNLKWGGYLHDIGKIGIPDSILMKPGKLTALEYEVMKKHTVIGERICQPMEPLRGILPIIRSHHERLDGTGYPDGLKGSSIPYLAQILQFLDIYDALTCERPYKKACSKEEALEILWEESDRGWRNPQLMKQFNQFFLVINN